MEWELLIVLVLELDWDLQALLLSTLLVLFRLALLHLPR